MAKGEKGSDKTEKPTRKRLRDARKEGDIAKSKELTSTLAVLGWLLVFWLMAPFLSNQLTLALSTTLESVTQPFAVALPHVAWTALRVFVTLTLAPLLAILMLALLVEYLQVGPIFAPKRVKPDASRLNPAEGLKKMFSMDNWVEVFKALFKTGALAAIIGLVVLGQLNALLKLPLAALNAVGTAWWQAVGQIGVWVVFVFLFISLLDMLYQRFSYTKKMRMSRRDIKREMKDDEGDPYMKARRRQLHQEWATRNVLAAVRSSSVLVTNPTHLAVALLYERGETVVPMVTAKGEEHLAALMREAAEEAGVPIMQNVNLARALHQQVEVDDYIPVEFFEAVAEVLRWADSIKAQRATASEPEAT
jgi:type III secretion protein U